MATSVWSAVTKSSQLSVNATTDFFYDVLLDLNPLEGADVVFTADFPVNPVAGLQVAAFGSLGGADLVLLASETLDFINGATQDVKRSSGDWTADGFVVGHEFLVKGSASDDGWYKVDAIVTTTNPNDTLQVSASGSGPSVPLSGDVNQAPAGLVVAGGLFSTIALAATQIGNAVDPAATTMVIRNSFRTRFAAQRTGSTDTITTDVSFRKDGIVF